MSEVQLTTQYVRPLFEALGWDVSGAAATEEKSSQADLELQYRDLRIPVQIKKAGQLIHQDEFRLADLSPGIDNSWAVVTDFETVMIWDLRGLRDNETPRVLLETDPSSYVADDRREDDLLAAEVFYQRLASPGEAGSEGVVDALQATVDVQALMRRLDDEDPTVRRSAAEELGDSGSEQAISALIDRLEDSEWRVRAAVAEALGKLGALQAYSALLGALGDHSEQVRAAAARALVEIGAGQRAIDALREVTLDPFADDDALTRASQMVPILKQAASRWAKIGTGAVHDAPTIEDRLDFLDYARALADLIKDEKTEMPLTIAIEGSWGMGKTSLMRMLRKELSTKGAHLLQPIPQSSTVAQESTQTDARLPWDRDMRSLRAEFQRPRHTLASRLGRWWSRVKSVALRTWTTFSTQLRRLRQRDEFFPTVWFEAWKYDKEESLWAAFALAVLREVNRKATWAQRLKMRWRLNRKRLSSGLLRGAVVRLVMYLGLLALSAVVFFKKVLPIIRPFLEPLRILWVGAPGREPDPGAFLGGAGLAKLTYDALKDFASNLARPVDLGIQDYLRDPDYRERVGFHAEIRDHIEIVIECITEGPRWPLAVFIDDLDRCTPPKACEIIEALNLLLGVSNCVFVIGMDPAMVASSIEVKYMDVLEYLGEPDEEPGLTLGQRFLQKIVQLSFHIPRPTPEIVEGFVVWTLTGKPPPGRQRDQPEEQQAAAEHLIKAEQRVGVDLEEAVRFVKVGEPRLSPQVIERAAKQVRAKSFEESEETQEIVKEAAKYFAANPRKIKRFINLFRLQSLIAHHRGLLQAGKIRLDLLAKWVVIIMRWPEAVYALMDERDFVQKFEEAHRAHQRLYGEIEGNSVKVPTDTQRTKLQSKIEILFPDVRLRRLVASEELLKLLRDMESAGDTLRYYLHLAETALPSEHAATRAD